MGNNRKAIPIRTNKASGLTARTNNNNAKGMYSDTYMQASASFITGAKFNAQGWAQLFTDMEESGLTARAWAQEHDGEEIKDENGKCVQVLKFETVNKYFSLIKWAMANLAEMDEDKDEDEVTVLDVLSEFTYITEIEKVKNGTAEPKAKKKSDPVDAFVRKYEKMTPAQQRAILKRIGK